MSSTTDVSRTLAAIAVIAAEGCTFELHDVVADAGGGGETVDPCNLTQNPSFEADVSFWVGSDSSLEHAALDDAVEGCCAARVRGDPATTQFAIRDEPPSVTTSVAGAAYRATAWVRSATSPANPDATVRLHLREGAGLDQIASTDDVPLTDTFQELRVTGIATLDADLIDVHLTQYQAVEGDAFYVDMIQLVRVDGCN